MIKLVRNSLLSICLLFVAISSFAAPECDYNESPGYSHCTYVFDNSGYDQPNYIRFYITLPDGTQTPPFELCSFETESLLKTSAPAGTYTDHIEIGTAVIDGVVQYTPYASQTYEHFGKGLASPAEFMVGHDSKKYPICDKSAAESNLVESEFFEIRTH